MAANATDVDELRKHFDSKILGIHALLDLRALGRDQATRQKDVEILHSIGKEITEIEDLLQYYKGFLAEQKESIATAKTLVDVIKVYDERVDHIALNLPKHLPRPRRSNSPGKKAAEPETTEGGATKKRKLKTATVSSFAAAKKCPNIVYLTTEEFEAVPRYMRGRLTYAKVNSAIDEIHKVLDAKFKILNTSRTAMSEMVMRKYREFKEQESDDTKGEFFFISKDLKEYSAYKLDKTGQAILCILRHCGRIREVRGGKLVRYVVSC